MEQSTIPPMVEAFSNCSEIMQRNARTFWEKQTKLLDDMQVYANGWFERRHAGTKAALEASQRMCGASTPLESLGEYQKWIAGVFVRLMADGSAYQNEIKGLVAAVAPSLVPSLIQEQDGTTAPERPKEKVKA